MLWDTDQMREAQARKSSEFASAFAIGFTNPQPFAFYLSIVPLVVGTTSLPILLVIVIMGFAIVTGIYVSLAVLIARTLENKANVVIANRTLSAIFLLLAIALVTR
jgi:threonine/homoserine/homoserine lactone efflux protein